MYLKSLELHGFKSFPNRTVMTFEKGTTVIVGPNGSGKSNISDAMRWVLGELSSRNIRGTKMEDVIFGGTDARRPMGFAEVSVTFDNSDHRIDYPYDEIKVTRRYYRTGESEYLINGEKRRLRDINELFLNTGVGREGYSIVGQGRVAELLSRKSEERRNVFEEAAGIAKSRNQMEEAEKRLKATEANLERILDHYMLLENRLGTLKKDSEKAKKYLELREKKKEADVSLWLFDTQKLRTDLARAEQMCEISGRELESVEDSLRSLQAQDERLFSQMESGRLASEELLNEINTAKEILHTLENTASVLTTEIRHLEDLSGQCRVRMTEIETSLAALDGEDGAYRRSEGELTTALAALSDERLLALSEVQKIEEMIRKIEKELESSLVLLNKKENAMFDLKVNIDILRRAKEDDGTRGEAIIASIEACRENVTRLEAEAAQSKKNAAGFTEKMMEIEQSIGRFAVEQEELRAEKESLAENCASLRAEKAALEEAAQTLRRMEEHLEGYNKPVQFLMREYNEGRLPSSGKVYGPVSQLIKIEPQYVVAMETALGGNLQHIVVEDERTAKDAIRHLKEKRAGRATFYPLDAIRAGNETEEVRAAADFLGYVDRADLLLTCDERFTEVFRWLLSRTVVFDTLENASFAARKLKYRVKLVTLDGQIINAGGSYTGGSLQEGKGSGFLSRTSDIDEKIKSADAIAEQILNISGEMADREKKILELSEKIKEEEGQKELLETMSRTQLAALESASARLNVAKEQAEGLQLEYDSLCSKSKEADGKLEGLLRSLESGNRELSSMRAERAQQDSDRNSLVEEREKHHEALSAVNLRQAELSKEMEMNTRLRESLAERIRVLRLEKEEQTRLVSEYRTAIESKQAEQTAAAKQAEETSLRLEALNRKRSETEEGVTAFNQRLTELREQMREKQEHKDRIVTTHHNHESKLHRLQEEQERLGSKLWEEYEISYEEAISLNYPPVTQETRSEVLARQTECRNGMKALGSVNIAAIEEFKEEQEEYDTMTVQVNDMRQSMEKELSIIESLEEEMKARFAEAFEEINQNFSEVFVELFGGGQAELLLADPDDILNCGIEIKAAPPGKIIKSLSLLSGGEQAFVAIALFFAILKVNPTPFCIFDEIEAALDAVNVYRFGEYIKKMNEGTQFILISHRPGTMEVAERLYGVTMPERGVSRVLPMDIAEMEKMKTELQEKENSEDGVF